ncbi:MAG: hypothetical protein P0Y58_17580 [Candidatus Pseudomonas phytovorans]|uniref:Toxin VasX N-terminal region domain-containing protein n=1 Tax=Candidatus Pseudomonas phytovorans TaxID=3121377 RepID=A0AAJ6BA08_9PSED|nr:T6SS effector BTH_I2691 family protein [Pseudomonas sp.]WEK28717.1 MAG: hypothetical protein P0Y58_17580 [Pseudomonas sp.]
MTLSQRIAIATAEAGLPSDQCMACERQGMPILPLRRALVPDARPGCISTVAGSLHVSAKMGLRTLRMGYLYVLLDQQVWHAYEVSEQGHLRRFNPYEPSDGPPASLPEKCTNENHDIPSSFLNIDTDRYGSAWLAFSSDAWPVSVLNAYKKGQAPAHRFEGLDLTQAHANPELLGIAMTPDNLQVDEQVGGLYLQYDSLSRNQEKAEAEIGPKAHEAQLALQGSTLGVLGGNIEVIGLIMRSGVAHVNIPWTRGVAVAGEVVIKIGAVISSIAGIFDMAQAAAASQRAKAFGDSTAQKQHMLAAAFYGSGSAVFAMAVFKTSFLGPLGLALMLMLAAYALSKHAEKNESSPLERWARRCCFGKADEMPVVHWKTPEYADIAFAELNAATLGVTAALHFESTLRTDPTAPRIGGLIGLEREQKLKFQIILPGYKEEVSAYRWSLMLHRCGDGEFPEFTGGEHILADEYHASSVDPLTKFVRFSGFAVPRFPDYKSGFGFDKKIHVAAMGEGGVVNLEVSGVLGLMSAIGSHSIVAATLLLMYWPDRHIDSAYVEVCSRGLND